MTTDEQIQAALERIGDLAPAPDRLRASLQRWLCVQYWVVAGGDWKRCAKGPFGSWTS